MIDLYIDRSTARDAVCLVEDGAIIKSGALEAHGGDWVSRLDDFLAGRKMQRFIIGCGPGSFAGVRSALAYAQGYSIGSGAAILGIASPCAYSLDEGPCAVIGDARRGLYWIALFEAHRIIGKVFLASGDEMPKRVPRGVKVFSPDHNRIGEKLKEEFGENYTPAVALDASGLARAALANPSLLFPEPLPIYLNAAVR